MSMVDVVTVEVIRCCLEYIAEEMGIALRNAAYSPNIKERMDHSCAIFDKLGRLVAQAEHIPTHLGSMPWGVRNTLKYIEKEGMVLEPGDVIAVNDPHIAGTHLNDVLILKPVFYRGELIAYVVNKAHQVDVGGKVPGSISGDATEIYQEGLIIPPIKIIEKGRFRDDIVKLWLKNVRAPEMIIGDIRAQVAACNLGEKHLLELVEKYGTETLNEVFDHILKHCEELTRAALRRLPDFVTEAEDYMEDVGEEGEAVIKVKVIKRGDEINIDYSGSSPQVSAPVNAPMGVTIAATTFALKTVIAPDLPINDGFYRPVRITAPEGTIVNAKWPAPVGASIETAQRIVDVLYLALSRVLPEKVPAAACGSMNNVLIGGIDPETGRTWAFYETVAGGYGGRYGMDGVDAVHCNMTNTMNTPIEAIERELPVLFTRYEIRPRSGGAGKWRGGMGVIRAFKLLAKRAVLTVVGERVKRSPWGLFGGLPGSPARYYVVRSNGEIEMLRSKESVVLHYGDEIVIETAGGGGYGDPLEREPRAVVTDYLNDLITEEDAEKLYGVVIRDGKLDEKSTEELRRRLRSTTK